MRCTELTPPEFGNITACDTVVGSFCNFTCNDGYMLEQGSDMRSCMPNGVWSGREPLCAREYRPLLGWWADRWELNINPVRECQIDVWPMVVWASLLFGNCIDAVICIHKIQFNKPAFEIIWMAVNIWRPCVIILVKAVFADGLLTWHVETSADSYGSER